MQGTIAFDGTLSGSIAGGGGGGGSEVTITPTLTSGTKIADYDIDGPPGELYAPTPSVVPEHIVTDIHGFNYTPYPTSEVARYTIDGGEEQSIYTPDYSTTWEAYPGVDQDYTVGILRCYGSTFNVKIPYYQKPLTAGTNITIDSDNVISAYGISYSQSEQDTGDKWIDGRTIYIKTIELTGVNFNISQNGFHRANVELHPYIPDAEIGWVVDDASYIFEDISDTYYYRNIDFWEWEGDSTLTTQNLGLFKRVAANNQIVVLTVKYVKGT